MLSPAIHRSAHSAERFEVEKYAVLQIRPDVVMKLDVCRVGIVRGPSLRLA
jgi:hypothetical protein